MGDTFGDNKWIDVTEERPCSSDCLCRLWNLESGTFSFVVEKTTSDMTVRVHSRNLKIELAKLLGHVDTDNEDFLCDGFQLLRSHAVINERIQQLNRGVFIRVVTLELRLLLEGLLSDRHIFESFGLPDLYEQGWVSYELWNIYQKQEFYDLIDALEQFDEFKSSKTSRKPLSQETADITQIVEGQYVGSGFPQTKLTAYKLRPRTKKSTKRQKLWELRLDFHLWYRRLVEWKCKPGPIDPFYQLMWPRTISLGGNFNSQIAWKTSINVMRRLCKGKLPQNVEETLLFLVLARAMGLIHHVDSCTESLCNCSYGMFSEDLKHWQRLFQDDYFDLERFRDAANELWGINMSGDITSQIPSEDLLNQFQETVLKILDRAEDALDIFDETGSDLLTVQNRWRAKTVMQEETTFEDQQPTWNTDNDFNLKSPGHFDTGQSPESESQSRHEMLNNSLRENQLFIFLIVGAIFVAVVSFIMGESC